MNFISKIFKTKEEPIAPAKTYPDSYEGDWQPRKLKNGSWVLWSERLGRARDGDHVYYSWPISNRFFRTACQGTRKQVHDLYLEIRYDKNPFEDELNP